MMKRLIGLLALSAILFSALPSQAAPKKFASCAALIKIYPSGIASTAKYVNRGAGPISKPRVDKAVFATNKKLDTDRDGIACERVIPKPAVTPKPDSSGAGLSATDKDSWKLAQAAVLKVVADGSVGAVKINHVLGPQLAGADLSGRKVALESAVRLWSKWYSPSIVEAIYWSENDAAWAEEKLASGWNYRPNLQQIAAGERGNCGSAAANGDGRTASFHECVGSNLANVLSSVQTTPHEYTHLFQNRYGGCAKHDWYCEGGAAFFGSTIGNTNDVDGQKRLAQLRLWSNNLGASKQAIAQGDKATVIRLLTEWQGGSHTRDAIAGSYFLGNLATEVLIASFGVERWAEFTIALAGPSDFEFYFERSFGVSPQSFYKVVADYVTSQPELFR